jgi:hypothetical protein
LTKCPLRYTNLGNACYICQALNPTVLYPFIVVHVCVRVVEISISFKSFEWLKLNVILTLPGRMSPMMFKIIHDAAICRILARFLCNMNDHNRLHSYKMR